MNFVRATKAAFAAYAFNNAIIGIIGGMLGLIIGKLPSPESIGQVVALIISAAVVYYCTLWYFQGTQKAGWENGLIVGAFFAGFSIVITLLQVIPQALAAGQASQIGPFVTSILSNIQFWISVASTVVAGAVAGYVKNPKV